MCAQPQRADRLHGLHRRLLGERDPQRCVAEGQGRCEGARRDACDAELNYRFGNSAYLGAGVGLWDFNHGDFVTPNALVHFGIPLWKAADQKTLFFVTEGRLFFDRISDADSNYQFWGGLRFLFR